MPLLKFLEPLCNRILHEFGLFHDEEMIAVQLNVCGRIADFFRDLTGLRGAHSFILRALYNEIRQTCFPNAHAIENSINKNESAEARFILELRCQPADSRTAVGKTC